MGVSTMKNTIQLNSTIRIPQVACNGPDSTEWDREKKKERWTKEKERERVSKLVGRKGNSPYMSFNRAGAEAYFFTPNSVNKDTKRKRDCKRCEDERERGLSNSG
jgi:uncharacterized protein with von Willebrand factor type A (vWA) domain